MQRRGDEGRYVVVQFLLRGWLQVHHVAGVIESRRDAVGLRWLKTQMGQRVLSRKVRRCQIEVSGRDVEPHVWVAGESIAK